MTDSSAVPTDDTGTETRSRLRQTGLLVITSVTLAVLLTLAVAGATPIELQQSLHLTGKRLREEMHFWLPALLGVLILWNESRLKRKLHRAEIAAHETEIRMERDHHDKELEFAERKLLTERKDREERLKHLTDEQESLRGLSEKLAKGITDELSRNTQWATQALDRARRERDDKTLFGERMGHFYDEKRQLAEQFLPQLLKRCRKLIEEDGKRVTLLIDSGTTLYPIFEQLAEAAVSSRANEETWLDKVQVVTNNLPGIGTLMSQGRRNPNNRFSPLAVHCLLLPGHPLPVYAAVTGKPAVDALEALEREASDDTDYFIALVTGNWIQLRSDPPCPTPLARGTGHVDLKQAFVKFAAETYVVTPLGKIFMDFLLHEINDALELRTTYSDADRQPYEEIKIAPGAVGHVRLVSTTRETGRVLHTLSLRVQGALHYRDDAFRRFVTSPPGQPQHLLVPFNQFTDSWYEEILTEFPHRGTRRPEFRQTYFFVDEHPPDRKRSTQ